MIYDRLMSDNKRCTTRLGSAVDLSVTEVPPDMLSLQRVCKPLEEFCFSARFLGVGAQFDDKVRDAGTQATLANPVTALNAAAKIQAWKETQLDYFSIIVDLLKEEIA